MLNLKELEQKLDDALSKETDESLTEWLMSKRKEKGMKLQLPMPNGSQQFAVAVSAGEYSYAMAA